MKKARVSAYAKINLVLDVLAKRADGYHEVSMVMQAISLADTVQLEAGPRNSLRTNSRRLPTDQNNLAMRAVALLQKEFPSLPPITVTLQKRIPIAAGLAGGSADCAAVLLGLNRLFGLHLSPETLAAMGASIGSDVPFCLAGPTALASGRGEILEALPECPTLYLVLVKPRFGVSTPKVYANLRLEEVERHPDVDACVDGLRRGNRRQILDAMGNLLECSTFRMHPEVEKLKQTMASSGCRHVLMSGSGPTVFAAFAGRRQAEAYYRRIVKVYPGAIFARTMHETMMKERVKIYGNESAK